MPFVRGMRAKCGLQRQPVCILATRMIRVDTQKKKKGKEKKKQREHSKEDVSTGWKGPMAQGRPRAACDSDDQGHGGKFH